MDWCPVHVSQFPISSSPRHEPTTRHHTPEPKRRHNPDQGPSKPKGPSEPKHPKTGRHDRARKPTGSGHRKSAPATAESSLPVGGQDLTHTPTLGSLPNRKRSNA